jgi:hypothetical protein
LKVNLLDPGPTRTKMRAQAYPGEDAEKLKAPEALAPLILKLTSPDCAMNGELVTADETP